MPTHRLVANTSDENLWGFTVSAGSAPTPAPEPRMHVRCFTVDNTPKVYLEDRGQRVWEPNIGFPPDLERAVRADLEIQRDQIETAWLKEMITTWGWLDLEQDGAMVTLTAYHGMQGMFKRTIDLRRDAGVLHPPRGDGEVMLVAEPEPAIVVYADRPARWWVTVPLVRRLWQWPAAVNLGAVCTAGSCSSEDVSS